MYRIIKFFKKLAYIGKWLPVLWKDELWDWTYILEILQFRIKCQREAIGGWDRHTTAQRDCHNMRTAELLLERLRTDEYGEYEWEEHNKVYVSRFEAFLNSNSNTWPAPSEEEAKDARRIINKEEYMWQQDWDYLSKHLKKYLKHWWD